MYDLECEQVDQFLSGYKSLDGLMPEWKDFFHRDWQLRWAIVDENEIQRAELSISCNNALTEITFCGIFNHNLIYRLDIVPRAECKDNPFSAMDLGLPTRVCGPHVHGWPENREYVRVNGFGRLPHRRPIDALVQTVADGLAWVSVDLGITVTANQRVCDLPPPNLFNQ